MGYILLGHGGLDVDPTLAPEGMEIVAIPQGTTIRFYTDPGQQLVYGSRQLDVWEQLDAPWPPLDSGNVTYNLSLHSAWDEWPSDLRNDPRFGGHQLIRAGIGDVPDPIHLCTGTPLTCPTTPAQVAAGQTHTCRGILGLQELQGEDLYWVACTPLDGVDRAVVDAVLEGRPARVLLGEDPDRFPMVAESDLLAISRVNGTNLAHARHGEVLNYYVAGSAFFVGPGHAEEHHAYAVTQEDFHRGRLTVWKETDDTSPVLLVEVTDPSFLVIEIQDAPPEMHGFIAAFLASSSPGADVYFDSTYSDDSYSGDSYSDGSFDDWPEDLSDTSSEGSSAEVPEPQRAVEAG